MPDIGEEYPKNIIPAAAKSGSMSTVLMLDYISRVLAPHVEAHRDENGEIAPTLLLMDAYRAHETDEVKAALKNLNIHYVYVPSKSKIFDFQRLNFKFKSSSFE